MANELTREWLKSVLDSTGHHPLGASSSSRWMTCPGSVAASKDMPNQTNAYAEEGTRAHALAEHCLVKGIDAVGVSGYPDEMCDHIQTYVDYVREVAQGHKLFVEQRLKLGHIIPEGGGTADAVCWVNDTLHIIDLKYGMGRVSPDSPQLKIYASGALHPLLKKGIEIKQCELHIFQPRNGGGSSVIVSVDEIHEHDEKVRVAADLCLTDDAPLNPSEKACEWCLAKASCPSLFEHSLQTVGGDFDVLPETTSLTDEQLRLVLDHKSLIEKWMKSIEAEVYSRFERGEKFDGYKVVAGRSIRKWSDGAEQKLNDLLGESAYERKLIGIGKAEKALGKKHLEELAITVKPEGKPVLVSERDKRPAVALIADDFSEL